MPETPDSLNIKSVQVDAPAGQPFDEPMDPETDGFKVAAIFLVEAGGNNLELALWRYGDKLMLRDAENPSGICLSDIVTVTKHKTLRQLIHFVDDGPAEGFTSGAYREILPEGHPFPTSVTWWESSAKSKKIVEKLIERSTSPATLVTPTPIKWKIYDTDGATVLWTLSDAVTYSGVFETSRTRTITSGDA